MSTPTTWYVRTGGSNANSGGTDSNTATLTGTNGVVVGTTLTDVAGGFNGLGSDALGINLQDAGNDLIRGYTVTSDTTLTLSSAPASGDGTYTYKIGGARASLAKTFNTGTGNNAMITGAHLGLVQGGTYTENSLSWVSGLVTKSSDGAEWVVDGTGGAGGSNCFNSIGTPSTYDAAFVNAVAAGYTRTSSAAWPTKCRMQANGTDGLYLSAGSNTAEGIVCLANAGHGVNATSLTMRDCELGNNTLTGGNFTSDILGGNHLVYGNGSDGLKVGGGVSRFYNCTIHGNTGDGVDMVATTYPTQLFINNTFSGNGGYGFNLSGGAGTGVAFLNGPNNFYDNDLGARNNIAAGAADTAVDPGFVDAAGDDYTLATGSALILAGESLQSSPMGAHVGATQAEIAAGGGGGGMPPTLFIGAGVRG